MYSPVVSHNNRLKWTFDNLSKWDKTMRYSDEFEIENAKWKIGVDVNNNMLNGHLNCSIDRDEKAWICAVDAKFSLLRQSEDTDHCQTPFSTTQYIFHEQNYYSVPLYYFHYVLSSQSRYNKNDSIIIEVEFDFTCYNVSKNISNYTDIVIKVGDVNLHLNKGFLSTVSKHFRDLFNTKECVNDIVLLENVKLSAFMKFLLFLHPIHVRSSEYHKDDALLQMAYDYGNKSIHWKNEEFMITESKLSAIKHLNYAEKYGYEKLITHVIKSLDSLDEIKKVVKTVEFEELRFQMFGPTEKYNNKLRWTFDNMSKWDKTTRYSDELEIENVKWKIGISVKKGYLYYVLNCSIDGSEKAWICAVDATFSLLKQEGTSDHQTSSFNKTEYFTLDKKECELQQTRYSNSHVCHSQYRFIKNDSIMVEVNFNFIFQNFSNSIPNYTDMKLKVEDVDLHLNKGLLCSCSQYFHDLLIAGELEDTIQIDAVDLAEFMGLLLFMHPTTLFITKNIYNFIKSGEFENHSKLAERFKMRSVHSKIALAIWSMTESLSKANSNSELMPVVMKCIKFGDKYGYSNIVECCSNLFKNTAEIKKAADSLEFGELSSESKAQILLRLLQFL